MNELGFSTDAEAPNPALAWLDGVSVAGLSGPELRVLAAMLGRIKNKADSVLCEVAAAVSQSGAGPAAVEVLQDSVRMSGREARRVARVAEQLVSMPNTAERLASGDITMDHATALANAAEQCGADKVDGDSGLLERAGVASSDAFAKEARGFAARKSPDRGEARLECQRQARTASMFVDRDTGMGRVCADFDPISFNLVEQAIDNRTDTLWRADGGRDGKPDQIRTSKQRRADAIFELITGRNADTRQTAAGLLAAGLPANGLPAAGLLADGYLADLGNRAGSSGRAKAANRHHAGGGPAGGQSAGSGDRVGSSGRVKVSNGRAAGGQSAGGQFAGSGDRAGLSGRVRVSNQLVVVADIGVIDGTDPGGRCEIIGTGPVPSSVIGQLSPDTALAGMIFGGDGRPLWLGRSRRLASVAQHLAVAVRDRGCVDCGAPMHRCEIHHAREWENGGPTDIDNLAALCGPHHRQHHRSRDGP